MCLISEQDEGKIIDNDCLQFSSTNQTVIFPISFEDCQRTRSNQYANEE